MKLKRKTNIFSLLILVIASACQTDDPQPTLRTTEEMIIAQVNDFRQQNGLPVLIKNNSCRDIALGHSIDMAEGYLPLGHDGLEERQSKASQEIGALSAGEMVASNFWTAESVVESWLNNPALRKTIEGDFTDIGVGIAEDAHGNRFYTQFLIKR